MGQSAATQGGLPAGYQPSPNNSAVPPDLSSHFRDEDGRWGGNANAAFGSSKPPPPPGGMGLYGVGRKGGMGSTSAGCPGSSSFATDVDAARGSYDMGARRDTSFATDAGAALDSHGPMPDIGSHGGYGLLNAPSHASNASAAAVCSSTTRSFGGDHRSDTSFGGGPANYGRESGIGGYGGSCGGCGHGNGQGSYTPMSSCAGQSMSRPENFDCHSPYGGAGPAMSSSMGTGFSLGDDRPPSGAGRSCWDVGSTLEVYSATANRWYVAHVIDVKQGADAVLTVQFYADDGVKQKSLYRGDKDLQTLGSNMRELPPGFETRPSQSRPGQITCFDATTGVKYASPELAWSVHFERLQQQPAVGCHTVTAMPPGGGLTAGKGPSGPFMTLSDLQKGGAAGSATAHAMAPIQESAAADTYGDGKTPLPCFGQGQASNQAAYLNYVGRPPAERALHMEAGASGGHAPARSPEQAMVGRQLPTVPRRNHVAKPMNPALQAWQEDPFSEWRS